ncbi:MAG: efflux RND transporter permease subunit [Puia sp.]
MSVLENIKGKFKEFGPTSWAINNKTSVYLAIIFVTILGIIKFTSTPKEQFPDIVISQIYVQTTYIGNSPKDIENLVTRPIEKQIKGIMHLTDRVQRVFDHDARKCFVPANISLA